MDLSPEQIRAIEHGAAAPVIVDGREFVIVSREVYDRVKHVIEYDDSDLSDDELRAIAARTLDDLDSAGPIE